MVSEPIDPTPAVPLTIHNDPIPVSEMIALSPVVASFLAQILNSVQLPASAENFEEQAAIIVQAKRELNGR